MSDAARRLAAVLLCIVLGACTTAVRRPVPAADNVRVQAFVDSLQARTFSYFRETTNPRNGIAPDRWPHPPFASIAAVEFALAAYPIGVERRWVTRADAAERTLITLRFMWGLPQGTDSVGLAGDRGFFYHFLDMETGVRYRNTELSTIDTGLLLAGVLVVQQYFDGADAREIAIRAYADSLYRRVEWPYFLRDQRPLITMAWRPERGFGPAAYRGYDEAMILYVLALGSPTHPIEPAAWTAFTSTYEWADFQGFPHVNFPPLFGHQYSHVFIAFRGIHDAYMRNRGIDYFENSVRATRSQSS